ncbi:MAG: hypothetical protein ACKPEQ_13675, partial [Dolichospermum sp.]
MDYLKYTKKIPTIFSGDLNIHPKSASVAMLSQSLEMLDSGEENTLNPVVHPIFKNSQSKGLKVDYIFQRGFEVVDYKVEDITVSDHLPLIAELELAA